MQAVETAGIRGLLEQDKRVSDLTGAERLVIYGMNKDLQDKIKDLETRQRQIADELEQLRNQSHEVVPWEPKGGNWTVFMAANEASQYVLNDDFRLPGLQFQTEAEAKAALKAYRFYMRLYKLACEVNPSGKVGGNWYVYWNSVWWCYRPCRGELICNVFETVEAVQKACEIMNRDKDQWEWPY